MIALRPVVVKALQKTRLNRLAHRVYYTYVHGFDTANRAVLPALDRCLAEVERRDGTGDYYEFGIFKGYAFWYAQDAARRLGLDGMRFFGFDSFRGLPEVQGADATAEDVFYAGQYACSKDQVTRNLEARGVDWDRTFLVEGYFEASLTEETRSRLGMAPVAVALIDCDLYESTAQVLEFIRPLLQDHSILMFDDWNCFDADDSRGQRLAFREFLRSHPEVRAREWFAYGHYGQVFSVTLDAGQRDPSSGDGSADDSAGGHRGGPVGGSGEST